MIKEFIVMNIASSNPPNGTDTLLSDLHKLKLMLQTIKNLSGMHRYHLALTSLPPNGTGTARSRLITQAPKGREAYATEE